MRLVSATETECGALLPFEIWTSPQPGYSVPTSVSNPILVVTLPSRMEGFRSDIIVMTYGTDFTLENMLELENVNFTNENLNTSIDKPETKWQIKLVSYNTLLSTAKPSRNGQLLHC